MLRLLAILSIITSIPSIWSLQISVVSVAIGDKYIEQVKPGIINKQTYSQIHGYDFHCSYISLDENRPPAWSKILYLKEIIDSEKYDWVFWMDADSVICNPNIKLESIIDDDYQFIITKGINVINSGVFFLKCSNWSSEFLQRVYWNHPESIFHGWWDNLSIIIEHNEND